MELVKKNEVLPCCYCPGWFSAQKDDVRVDLQRKDFLTKFSAQNSHISLSCNGLPRGCQKRKEFGGGGGGGGWLKDKLTSCAHCFFVCQVGSSNIRV